MVGRYICSRESGWDSYAKTRIATVVYTPPVFTAFYDGSADVSENYEERTGIAISLTTCGILRELTYDGPILVSPLRFRFFAVY